jgi:hypothetical protein
MADELPHFGRWQKAKNRKFDETIVFVHHFGGNRSTSKRHQEFVNDLGFDCVAFDLAFNSPPTIPQMLKFITNFLFNPLSKIWLDVWIDQINDIPDAVPGKKILYSFSTPSAAAPGVIVEKKRQDVTAWVTDGGPFLDAWKCLGNYYRHQTKLTPHAQKIGTAVGYALLGQIGFEKRVNKWMRDFPAQIPILSVRSGRDKLVPVSAIDLFFHEKKKNLEVFEISESEHLEGLKTFPEKYRSVVGQFLSARSDSSR